MRALLACTLLLAVVPLSGCFGGGPASSSSAPPNGHGTTDRFDALTDVGKAPTGWTASSGSTWTVEANLTAPSLPNVVRGHGGEARNWLLADKAGTFGDMDAKVRFNLQSSGDPGGAGMVFHFVDATHYYIVRYSPSEAGWHLFVANGGDPSKKSAATTDTGLAGPQVGQWADLSVAVEGNHIEARQGTTIVIDYQENDATAPAVGMVGLFTRGDTVALFDDFEVDP